MTYRQQRRGQFVSLAIMAFFLAALARLNEEG